MRVATSGVSPDREKCHFFDRRSRDQLSARWRSTVHHDGKKALVVLALTLTGAGCSTTHEPLAATTGVYDLTIAGEVDACSPMRATGPMGTAGVVQQGAFLTLSVPDLTTSAPMLVSLNSEASFTDEHTDALGACTNATLSRTYSVVSHDGSGFDVAYTETWSGLSTCGAAMRSIMPAAPSADCRADLMLHYRLSTPCAAPCQVRVTADGAAACHC